MTPALVIEGKNTSTANKQIEHFIDKNLKHMVQE
jgi:hypothetical protein